MGNEKNYIGMRFGSVEIIDELPAHITPNGSKQRIVLAKCDCGNEYAARLSSVKKNDRCVKCLAKSRRVDISGQRFGKLVVVSMADDYYSPSGHRLSQCNCMCDCGNSTIVAMSQLVTGSVKSCGCLLNSRGMLKDNLKLMKEYDYEKNIGIDLNTLTAGCNTKVWWKCEICNNSWFATIASRNDDKKKHGCPFCSGRFVLEGKTDLLSQYPLIAEEWDYEKNDLLPNSISKFSSKKVWWKCKRCGNSWNQTVANRTFNNSGCPKCNIENVNSFCEQAFYYYIKQAFPDSINGDSHIGMELDIFIPSINIGIEYDGEVWHDSKKKKEIDSRKNLLCIENNITLIRIREPRLLDMDNCVNFRRVDSTTSESLNKVIINVLNYLNVKNIDVNIEADCAKILEQYASKKYTNSLLSVYPEIAAEWHPIKNGNLRPEQVNKSARLKVWWLGKCGHEWNMAVKDRTLKPGVRADGKRKKGYNCPYCSGKRILVGFNDLQSNYPEIASEWHPEKNGDLTPLNVSSGSRKKVWWLGKCGHEWQQVIEGRTKQSQGCPLCYRVRNNPSVVCVETGIVYENAEEACDALGLKSKEYIYRCCNGKQVTTGGYHWKYNVE